VTVTWQTEAPGDSRVTLTSTGVWWPTGPDTGPDADVSDDELVTDHELGVSGLEPGKTYAVRIRSSNRELGLDEVIWGTILEDVIAPEEQPPP
jgi:hypothetical protein